MKKWGSTTSCLESARALSVPGATSLVVTATTSTASTTAAAAASSSISVAVSVSVPGARSPLSGSRPVTSAAGGQGHRGVTNLHAAKIASVWLWGRVGLPLPATSVELPPQLTGYGLQMHEVAEATASAFPEGWRGEESNLATGDCSGTLVFLRWAGQTVPSACIWWRNSERSTAQRRSFYQLTKGGGAGLRHVTGIVVMQLGMHHSMQTLSF